MFISIIMTTGLILGFSTIVAILICGGNPVPIWVYQHILRREVRLVKLNRDHEMFKVLVRKDPFGDQDWGYRYHTSKVGIVTFNPNGTAYYCGDAKWKKL